MLNVACGSPSEEKRQAWNRRREEAGLHGFRERFGGGPKCLTLQAGLPPDEQGLKAAEVAGSAGSVLRLLWKGLQVPEAQNA